MRAVVQRVSDCRITVAEKTVGAIDRGLLVYLGIGKEDGRKEADFLAEKIIRLRLFADQSGKPNFSLAELGWGIAVVSQFTLYADTRKGRRPSWNRAAEPELAQKVYRMFIESLTLKGCPPATGCFGADMRVSYINDGPVTIWLDTDELLGGRG